jgi:tetratricopeptide (TPR) repeat protein
MAHPGHAEAKRRIGETMQARPDDAHLFVERARHERLEGNPLAARRDLAAAAKLEPDNAALAFELAELAHLEGDDELALEHLNRSIARDPRWWRPWRLRAQLLEETGRAAEAVEAYFELLERRPRPDTYLRAAALLEAEGAGVLAERVLAEASLSGSIASRLAHVELLRRLGWHENAADRVAEFRQREPEVLVWAELAVEVELDLGRSADALERLEEARGLARTLIQRKPTAMRLAALESLDATHDFLLAYRRASDLERRALACLP